MQDSLITCCNKKNKKVFENIKPRFALSILCPKGISKGPKVPVIPV